MTAKHSCLEGRVWEEKGRGQNQISTKASKNGCKCLVAVGDVVFEEGDSDIDFGTGE